MQTKLLVDAGEMKPGPALSQKLGPLGINIGKVISEVNNATKEFTGMKVPVILDIDTKTKGIKVKVLTPSVSALLKREIGIEKGSPMPNQIKVANIPIELVIKIAKIKEKDMLVSSFKSAVKTVIGSCQSLGILIESRDPKELLKEIEEGLYDHLLSKQVEEVSNEKLVRLAKDFEQVKKRQQALLKELEEKKAKATEGAAAARTSEAIATTEKKEEEKK
ncbi:MAG: 50S ribosomal protein L11 [Candidatus Pacearchaeota archaeon]